MRQEQARHIEHLSVVYSERHYGIHARLAESLQPRAPSMLLEVAGEYLPPRARVLDVGCRDAGYLVQLAERYGCRGAGIDPLEWHVRQAVERVRAAGLGGRIEVQRARMEELPFADASFDLVWCRDVLALIDDLNGGLAETTRVLRPGGHLLVYTAFATRRLEAREAAMLYEGLGNIEANMEQGRVEAAFLAAGLTVVRKDVIGTEWREYEEERTKPASGDLLTLARLRRSRQAIVEEYGERIYRIAEASLHWLTYILLGKLLPVLYILRREQGEQAQ